MGVLIANSAKNYRLPTPQQTHDLQLTARKLSLKDPVSLP